MSAAPDTSNANSDSANTVDSAKTIVARPYSATAANITRPTHRVTGHWVSATDMASAPTAGAPRSKPSPHGPT